MLRKLPLWILPLVLGSALGWAAPPSTDSTADTIQSRLDHAKVNKHGDVQVTYANGVATLTGTVDNVGTKLDAEKAAERVHGVSQVVNNIQVSTQGIGDQLLLQRARHEIVMYYAYGIFDNVEFSAHDGALTVSGQVTEPFKKNDMGNILAHLKGVTAFQNNLEVLPVSSFDDRLRLQVARAIYNNPNFVNYGHQALPSIHIIVKNGNVTLEGVVDSAMDRTMAEMTARRTGLSFAVIDNLRVIKS